MAIAYNTSVVRSGVALQLDAANRKSYPGSGTTWTDLSGNANNGTLTNGVGYNTANMGAMVFDGIDDYVDCGPASMLNGTLTGLTVGVWYKVGSSGSQILAENGTSFTLNTFYIAQENTNNLSFLVADPSERYQRIYGTSSYTIGSWYHFVGVWSSGTNLQAYINGVNTSQSLLSPTGPLSSLRSGNTNLWIGRRPNGGLVHFGSIAQVSIYTRALSASEIAQNFEAQRGRYGI